MAITTAMIKELRDATGAGILDSKKALEVTNGDFARAVEHLREKGLAKAAKKASREANEGVVSVQISEDGRRASLVEVNCETDFVARTDDFGGFVANITRQVFENANLTTIEALTAANYIADAKRTVADAAQGVISKLGENIVVRNLEQYTLEGEGIIEAYIHSNKRVGVLVELGAGGVVSDRETLKAVAHDLTLQIAALDPRYVSTDDVPSDVIEEERKVYSAQLVDEKKPDQIKARIVEGRLKKFFSEICLLEQKFIKDDSLSINKLLQQAAKNLGSPVTVRRFTRFEIGAG